MLRLGLGACLLAASLGCSGRLSGGHGPASDAEPPPVPPGGEALTHGPGLRSVVSSGDAFLITWNDGVAPGEAKDSGGSAPLLALFGSIAEGTLYDAPPAVADLDGSSLLVDAMPPGLTAWFGLGLSLDDGASWHPVGPVLRATTRPPIYVDPDADPEIADGASPQTAFPTPLQALLTAFLQGGGNVWLREGDYGPQAVPIFAGTAVCGGFPAGFDLAGRDPAAHPTILRGVPGQPVLNVQGGADGTSIDGLVLEGDALATAGIEVTDTPLEIRGVCMRAADGPGLRIQAPETGDALRTVIVDLESSGHAAEGLSARGGLALRLDGCTLTGNGQEGLDLDDLVAPAGRTARLIARDCLFAGNGSEGADVDLAAPIAGGAEPGAFDVLFERCVAVSNRTSGIRIDLEYEASPGWTAVLVARGITTRGNGGDGISLDLDADASTFLHRVVSSANAGDGVRVTSEILPVLATVSTSSLMGNGGAGLRAAAGQATVLFAHGVLAGNALGGLVAEVTPGVAVSSVAWRQSAPWSGSLAHGVAVADDPLSPTFWRAPEDFGGVIAVSPPPAPPGGIVPAPGAPVLSVGDLIELADDGTARLVVALAGVDVQLDPPSEGLLLPARFARFGPADTFGGGVVEDWRVRPGSAAEGAGMAAPGAPPVDAGPYGAPLLAHPDVPGDEALVPAPLFRVARIEPPPGEVLGDTQSVRLVFEGGTPDPFTASAASVRVLAQGASLPVGVLVEDGALLVSAPAAGWNAASAGADSLVLEVHALLASQAGLPLAAPLVIPLPLSP